MRTDSPAASSPRPSYRAQTAISVASPQRCASVQAGLFGLDRAENQVCCARKTPNLTLVKGNFTPEKGAIFMQHLQDNFLGTDTEYTTANGNNVKRVYLDSAASTLMPKPTMEVIRQALSVYANPHSGSHFSANATHVAYSWARRTVLSFLGAESSEYRCVFMGRGSTAALNYVARSMADAFAHKPTVLVSGLEHHSNDLPHRRHSQTLHLTLDQDESIQDLPAKAMAMIEQHKDELRYLAVTAASNVTGSIVDLKPLIDFCRQRNIVTVVDASQLVAHEPVRLGSDTQDSLDADVLVFSGHKAYAPGSPGVLVIRRSLLEKFEPTYYGGGMVDRVSTSEYEVSKNLALRFEGGTPDAIGAIALAASLRWLQRIGMEAISAHERELTGYLLGELARRDKIRVYESSDLARHPRTPCIAFNLEGVSHGLLGAILNDFYGIEVRTGCFCAQPYVRRLLRNELWDMTDEQELEDGQGMVRVSLGLYSKKRDIQRLLAALDEISANLPRYRQKYERMGNGHFALRHSMEDDLSLQIPEFKIDEIFEREIAKAHI